ncbi:hypothetical protein CJ670_04080 [Arcobacter cryaerophilus gv. crypticus]|uniref:Glycosyltransferase 2-like domain-containing protein n=2 Tax=Aliarcobacter cryaerophilus TaxID=28198 RepID=A0A2S9THI1_9BACT|nr:hypothetical protein CJ670_04080 [Arcobacter cryaerophilus gv. crypticus]
MQQNKCPKVTVVTVTYNAEKYLEQTIKSVIEQDYPNIEYIIIDGASTDGTIDIIKQYEEHIDYWISEPDRGIYDAMNKGIDVATAEWINFMNAGDSFASNNILKDIFNKKTFEKDFDVLYGGVKIVDENYNYKEYISAKPMSEIWKGSYCNHQSLFVKTSIMKKNKFNLDYKLAAEKELFIKLYVNKYSYKIFDFPISNFIISDNSFSTKHKIIDSIEMLYILTKYINSEEKILNHNHYKRLVSYTPKFSASYNNNLSIDLNILYDFAKEISKKYNKIAIYGNSKLFKMIKHIFVNNEIKIYDKFNHNESINALNNINKFNFEVVFITVLGREEEIIKDLIDTYKVEKSKIISILSTNQ